ncbi:SDR family NAD(P)-dependent oxidoreductase, partial [Roseibium denhamense]
AHVVVVDQEIQSVEEVASGLNGESMAAAIDLREEEHIADLVAKIVARFGRLDILHNNAACKPKELRQFFKPVEQFQMDVWREIMSVNIDAMFCVAKHAGGYMAAHGGGAIIQT